MADPDKGPAKLELTPKQEAFALAYVETGNAAEAYRRAYDVKAATQKPIGCYVYALVEAAGERIVYVGKGTGDRMHHHLRDARNGRVSGMKKYIGLRHAIEDGLMIEARCIEDGMTEPQALRFERALICRIGFEKLLNSHAGEFTADERAVMRGEEMIERLVRNLPVLTGSRRTLAAVCICELQDAVAMARRKAA